MCVSSVSSLIREELEALTLCSPPSSTPFSPNPTSISITYKPASSSPETDTWAKYQHAVKASCDSDGVDSKSVAIKDAILLVSTLLSTQSVTNRTHSQHTVFRLQQQTSPHPPFTRSRQIRHPLPSPIQSPQSKLRQFSTKQLQTSDMYSIVE